MTIQEIMNTVEGTLLCGDANQQTSLRYAFASDLMSDVLTVTQDDGILITGLASAQAVRTAMMSDIHVILFVRNKRITEDIVRLAEQSGITVIVSAFSMFRAIGLLYNAGLQSVY
ncbi:MAG: hypothetical protein EA403_09205 [Spirochaetaceae bacterium]|nr:MAG: hypothetical protein EA403_09205 [Spirochaetaceae bacterium]